MFRNEVLSKYTLAITEDESKKVSEILKALDMKDRQKFLDDYVTKEGLDSNEISELMYDLGKHGVTTLKKPTPAPQNKKKHSNRLIAAVLAGKIDDNLGTILNSAHDKNTVKEVEELVEFFKKNPKEYGKFINLAEKNEIGFYENNLDIPITKEALEQVGDDYILNSILYSSVYGSKKVTPDGVVYAFQRFNNPMKEYKKNGGELDIFYMASSWFTNSSERKMMKKWFDDLSSSEQKDVRDYWGDDKPTLDDYLS